MVAAVSVLALLLVAVTMGLSLAHGLEFPGKRRLEEPTYRAVQTIYYPGFTIGGLVGEFGSILTLVVLLVLTPQDTGRFWWTAMALGLLIAGHATYWAVTHPTNKAWLTDTHLSETSRVFFGLHVGRGGDWKRTRNIWEWSHVARATLFAFAFLSMTLAVVL